MLDKRLNAILESAGKCEVLADIGTDHGLLCLSALQTGVAKKVIATDISDKSLKKAVNLLTENGYQNQSSFRCGDGFGVLEPNEADVVVVSGMGGREICKMLACATDFSAKFVLSPQSDISLVRKTLMENGFKIVEDYVVESHSKFYDIIVSKRGNESLSEFELEYGKISLRAKSKDYLSWLDKEIEKATNLSGASQKAKERFDQRAKELLSIKIELIGGKDNV